MPRVSATVSNPIVFQLFAAFQAGDAIVCIKPIDYVARCMDDVHFPRPYRWIFPVVKGSSAVGLVLAQQFPKLARFTAVMLAFYFALTVGAHVRAKDVCLNAASASGLLVVYTTLAVVGPKPRE